MIVLIEGVDGSGKTTLCKRLVERGFKLLDIPQNEHQGSNYKMYSSGNYVYICDRSFITDLVYRIEDGGKPTQIDLYTMLRILSEGTKLIICKSTTEYEDSMKRGEDNIVDEERNLRIRDIYDIVAVMFKNFAHVPTMYYNWRMHNISDVIKFIEGGKQNDSVSV